MGKLVTGLHHARHVMLCMALALISPVLHAGFDEAAAYFSAGKYDLALKEIQPLAEKGDARCQYSMGVLYENGFGVEKNQPLAAAWYLKAAEQGNSDAQFNLGAMNEHGTGIPVNYVEAARWYRPAAEVGDVDALSNLGVLYDKGQGVPQDQVLAMALYNVSVAYSQSNNTQAARNRQGLANRMPLDDVKKALALTEELLKPNNLKPGLAAYINQPRKP
jgi:TPR repeat protein